VMVRFRVAGLTMALYAPRPTSAIALPKTLRPFACARGNDIRLTVTTDPVPQPSERRLLFDSGAVWRVYRWRTGLLYTFSTPVLDPPVYKAVEIDPSFRRGVLYYPRPVTRYRPGSALDFPLDELLFQHRLARNGDLELHACGVLVNGRAVLFCGQSGAGKTTTSRLWRAVRPGITILSDDRVIVRRRQDRLWAYGTPWHGAGCFASPEGRPVGAVFFLQHAPMTAIRQLDAPASTALLFARTFPPMWDRQAVRAMLATCGALAEAVPCHVLEFRPDRSAVTAVLGTMPGRDL
jgi:hypothetical protein